MSSTGWLSASTAERTRELVMAINALVIDSSLKLRMRPEPKTGDLDRARELLLGFITHLNDLVSEAQKDKERPVVGADPQLTRIVRGLVAAPNSGRPQEVSVDALRELRHLLRSSPAREDLPRLIQDLRALRRLLERYAPREIRIR
jgi:hypothetical protein